MTQILWVARRDGLPGASSTQNHVGIDDIHCSRCREEAPDAGGVESIEGHHVRRWLADQTCEPGLARWIADRLREGRWQES